MKSIFYSFLALNLSTIRHFFLNYMAYLLIDFVRP